MDGGIIADVLGSIAVKRGKKDKPLKKVLIAVIEIIIISVLLAIVVMQIWMFFSK